MWSKKTLKGSYLCVSCVKQANSEGVVPERNPKGVVLPRCLIPKNRSGASESNLLVVSDCWWCKWCDSVRLSWSLIIWDGSKLLILQIDPNRWFPAKYDHSCGSFGILILSHCHSWVAEFVVATLKWHVSTAIGGSVDDLWPANPSQQCGQGSNQPRTWDGQP